MKRSNVLGSKNTLEWGHSAGYALTLRSLVANPSSANPAGGGVDVDDKQRTMVTPQV